MGVVIDQNKNYGGIFGSVYRSSAIFYKPPKISCTVSVSNYWDFKNSIEVGVVVTLRKMSGKLIDRKEYRFDDANVLNIKTDNLEEGSIEVESFSNRNVRIPYAAVMAVYETDVSVSMVHSYGRNHSLIELEDKNSLTEGRESCWTVRSSESVLNSAFFHNGHLKVESQIVKIILTDTNGVDKVYDFKIPDIKPFETIKFSLDKICPDYKNFLNGLDGWASIHFNNHSSFTRLLVTWEDKDTGHFQVTHSNFDYSEHQTNLISATKPAYMKLPKIDGLNTLSATVYPKFTPGKYTAKTGDSTFNFETGIIIKSENDSIEFERDDGDLPARIVTGIIGNLDSNHVPFECSLGIVHENRPPKRFHWAVISKRLSSKIYITNYKEIYGIPKKDIIIAVSLYNAKNKKISKSELKYKNLDAIPSYIDPKKIFSKNINELGNDFGYVSVFCEYGGLFLFSTITKGSSMSLEHSF